MYGLPFADMWVLLPNFGSKESSKIFLTLNFFMINHLRLKQVFLSSLPESPIHIRMCPFYVPSYGQCWKRLGLANARLILSNI